MAKFKEGDKITPIEAYRGFENATVLSVGKDYYHLRIVNGTATIPIQAEINYKKVK